MRYFVRNIIFCERWHFPPEPYISLTLENTQSCQIQAPQSLLTLNALPAVWSCLNCLWGLLPGSGLLEPPPTHTHCTGVPAWPPPIIWAVLRRAERGQVSHCPHGGHWGMAYPGGHRHPVVFVYRGVAAPVLFSEPLTKPLWRSLVSEGGQTRPDSDLQLLLPVPLRGDGPCVPCGLGATVDPNVAHQFRDGLPWHLSWTPGPSESPGASSRLSGGSQAPTSVCSDAPLRILWFIRSLKTEAL